MKILLLTLLLGISLPAFAHEFQFNPRAGTVNTVLPDESVARALLRVAISEHTGAPLDIHTPIPLLSLDWAKPECLIEGERCWVALFNYRGKPARITGHGEVALSVVFAS
jgi:hypothetical protein